MRKISKLALLIIAVVSFVCFLFYKMQYDKLYNVLQFLEFFGTAKSGTASYVQKGCLTAVHDAEALTDRGAFWQPLNTNVFIYSAYCEANAMTEMAACPLVTILAAIVDSEPDVTSQFSCKMWFEGIRTPVAGIFTSSPLLRKTSPAQNKARKRSYQPFLFYCENKFPTVTPYGISFFDQDGFVDTFASVQPKQSSQNAGNRRIAACIGPQDTPQDSTALILEQILLQNYFGIDSFILYDRGLTNSLASTLSRKLLDDATSNTLGNVSTLEKLPISVRSLAWNAPRFENSTKELVILSHVDCHFRTRMYESRVFLNPGQILVPKKFPYLHEMLSSMEKTKSGGNFDVSVRKFCSEYPLDKPLATSLIGRAITPLRKSLYSRSHSDLQPKVALLYRVQRVKWHDIKLEEDDVLVYDYGSCGTYNLEERDHDTFIMDKANEVTKKIGKYFPYIPK